MPNLTDNATHLLEKRYFLKNQEGQNLEDWRGLCSRVASFTSQGNPTRYLEYFNAIYNLEFLPSSPQLMFLGTKRPMPSSCFVLGPIKDNLDSILEILRQACLAQKHSGGCGYNFSFLRPEGEKIASTGGEASGPVSFMHLYDQAMQVVVRAGKKQGAQMAVLNCDHPEIFKFIRCKDDNAALPTFNVSVGITDAFMEAVTKDLDWDLKFGGEVFSTVKARDIWNEIAKRAWENGDPGVLFLDTANMYNRFDRPISAVNPCVTGDTYVLTKQGQKHISFLVGSKVKVWNGEEFSEVEPFSTGVREILEVQLSNGATLKCTPEHKFILKDGNRINAEDLRVGDKLAKFDMPYIEAGEDYLIDAYSQGFYAGDGNTNLNKSWIYSPKYVCIERLQGHFGDLSGDKAYWGHGPMFQKEFVPINGSAKYCLNWLSGLLDSNGTVVSYDNSDALQISSTNYTFLDNVRMMLSRLSVRAKISHGEDNGYRCMPGGKGGTKEYWCKATYRLLINCQDTQTLLNLGLKTERLKIRKSKVQRDARRFIQVSKIRELGYQETFCFTEPKAHRGCFNGVVTGQCGEIPAPDGYSCNLGSINLSLVVDDSGEIMWDKLDQMTRTGIRFLDDVIDNAWWPIEEITNNAKKDRNIGLGVMGFADMLILMGTPYASEEGITQGYEVMRFISEVAEKESISRGSGERKNVTLTSIAPTGSRSFIANCSAGIEPIFGIVSINNTKLGSFYSVNQHFEKIAKEKGFYSTELLRQISEEGSIQNIESIPQDVKDIFQTATEIDYTWHIRMQAAFQRNTDTAISKTVNISNGSSIDDVKKAFLLAYDLGCKSTTVYRDGSRSIQVLENKTNNHSCPDCGEKLSPKEGCWTCENCGYSLCSLL